MGFTTAAILTTAGMGLQAYGQYKASQDQAKAEEYNAAVARQEAAIIREKGKLEADRQRKQAKRFSSTQEALIAKAGIAFTGSAFEVYKDSAEEMELDALLIEYNSSVEESRALREAEERDKMAKRIRRSGVIDAATTVLTQSAGYLSSLGSKTSGTVGNTGKTQSQILGYSTARYR